MGDLQSWPPAATPSDLGSAWEHRPPPPSPALPPVSRPPEPDPRPEEIKVDNWLRSEGATRDVLQCIQPTAVSDQQRRAVVNYVHSLLRSRLGCEVFSFGSVPLKTYLPDGDIDLTALGYPNREDDLSNDVHSILLYEERNREAEFKIKDVQSIHAEVKLVKCIIQNIIVDISFNQIGGLRTLCFLEQIDCKIGKDHLFKRSIILIKAWCYYESRILGAHHGLISTYALETLVLYVFHLYHRTLNAPLAVLYRFLDFYSKFDWDNYCVSLNGPVSISSLPELVVELPETNVTDLLFTNEFIKECLDQLSVPGSGLESDTRVFPKKYLNIIDPLKQNNNLGRSVSKGNFYRIRGAFSYGARKLGHILMLPAESISGELRIFFTNTLDRHGSGERPDVEDLPSNSANRTSDHNEVKSTSPSFKIEDNKEGPISGLPSRDLVEALAEETKSVEISDLDKEQLEKIQVDKHLKCQHLDTYGLSRCDNVKSNGFRQGNVISDMRLSGDAKDLASTWFCDSRNLDESLIASSRIDNGVSHISFHLENCSDSVIYSGKGSVRNVALSSGRAPDAEGSHELESSSSTSWFRKTAGSESVCSAHFTLASNWSSYIPEDSSVTVLSNEERVVGRSPGSVCLPDLAGDYQIYLKNLKFAQELQYGTASYIPFYPLPSQYQNKHSWNTFQQHAFYTSTSANGLVPGTLYSPNISYYNTSMISGTFGTKNFPRTRGTGTYFPNTNTRSYTERQTLGRGKNHIRNQSWRNHNSGGTEILRDRSLLEGGNNEQPQQLQSPKFRGNGCGRPSFWDMPHSSPKSAFRVPSSSNENTYMLGGKLEFGSLGPIDNSEAVSSSGQVSGSASASSTTKKPSTSANHERAAQPYRLKDGDFPPLG